MERTIRVTGKGNISISPDMVRIVITQTSVEPTYEMAVKESADEKNSLTSALETLGFKKEDLKTLYFNVDSETESYQTKDKSWRRRLLGYRFAHRMKIEFSKESDLLGKVLALIAASSSDAEFSIEYTVSDPVSAKNELLRRAVEDSRKKAVILTEAAGAKLGEILNMDYSWGQVEFVTRPIKALALEDREYSEVEYMGNIDVDIEPDDIDVSDTVTVVWALQ